MPTEQQLISIYALVDPDSQKVRYVGRSHNPEKRLRQHMATAKDIGTLKEEWLYFLKLEGKKPLLVILEEVPWQGAEEAELWWIFHYYDSGEQLCNQNQDIGRARQKFGALAKVNPASHHDATWCVNAWREVTLLTGSQQVRSAWERQTVSPFCKEQAGIFQGTLSLEELPSLGLFRINVVNQAMLMSL